MIVYLRSGSLLNIDAMPVAPNLDSYSATAQPVAWIHDIKSGRVNGDSSVNIWSTNGEDTSKYNCINFVGGVSDPSFSFVSGGDGVGLTVRVSGVSEPNGVSDVATKGYVDGIVRWNSQLNVGQIYDGSTWKTIVTL